MSKKIDSVMRIINGKTAGDISTLGVVLAGIRCYEAGRRSVRNMKQKPRMYLGVMIHRNTEPHKLRWWALTPSGQVASNRLDGIKSLIRKRVKA